MGYSNKEAVLATFRARKEHGKGSPEHRSAQQKVIETTDQCTHPEKDHKVVPIVKSADLPGFEVGLKMRYCLRCSRVLEKNIT
jgi:hypothetical protein